MFTLQKSVNIEPQAEGVRLYNYTKRTFTCLKTINYQIRWQTACSRLCATDFQQHFHQVDHSEALILILILFDHLNIKYETVWNCDSKKH